MFLRHTRDQVIWVLAFLFPWGIGCTKSTTQGAATASGAGQLPVEIVQEKCDVNASGAVSEDANQDGRPDLIRVMKGPLEICRVVDLNFDGRMDNYLYFDEAGNLRRRETDCDRDGLIDEIAIYKNGAILYKYRETNLDGKFDTWDTFTNDRLTERLRDTDGDGKVDQWWTFPDPSRRDCPVIAIDETGNGQPDIRIDPCKEREAELAASSTPSAPSAPKPQDSESEKPDPSTAPHDQGGL